MRIAAWGLSAAAWVTVAGCSCEEDRFGIAVDVRTDVVPGVEFHAIRTELFESLPPGDDSTARERVELPVYREEDWLGGRRAADLDTASAGTYTVRATLLDAGGSPVASRLSRIAIRARTAVTIIITRDCRAVVCDPAQTCSAGRCVDPRCTPETPEACPVPECELDADCVSATMCAEGRCVAGACLFADVDRCAAGEYCDPDRGCRMLPVETDGGPADAGPPDAGLCLVPAAGEACNGADDDCDGTVDEGLGSFICGAGACRTVVDACTAGVRSTCTPGTPAPAEICDNGIDDECDGVADDDCRCVHVEPTGDDVRAVSDGNITPFATVQAAIDWAALVETRPRLVCVAAGPACGAPEAVFAGDVTMADGISVAGGYESLTWSHCPTALNVTLRMDADRGLVFPAAVGNATLAQLRVRPASSGGARVTGVSVEGARGVRLERLIVEGAVPPPMRNDGLDATASADVEMHDVTIHAGPAMVEAIGVHALSSTVRVLESCSTIRAGRCADACGMGTAGIRATAPIMIGSSAIGVHLENAPGSLIDHTAVCAVGGRSQVAVRLRGDATGVTLRENAILADGGEYADAIAAECLTGAPWFVDNPTVATGAMITGNAVHASGSCGVVLQANPEVVGCAVGTAGVCGGVRCTGTGSSSRCLITGNGVMPASAPGTGGTAISCTERSCARVEDNVIGGFGSVGVLLIDTSALVARNVIRMGCSSVGQLGIGAFNSGSRIENNLVVTDTSCPGTQATGLSVAGPTAEREVDVHSNTFVGIGGMRPCPSISLAEAWLVGPSGVFRNNAFIAHACAPGPLFQESAAATDPRVLENNEFDPRAGDLYEDEGGVRLDTVAAIDGLTDITSSGNVSAAPGFVAAPADLHVSADSPLVNAGTRTGAPAADFEGSRRDDGAPDIGADER